MAKTAPEINNDAPHPRSHNRFYGHTAVCADIRAFAEKMPHGILLYGERGAGKATLAYRIARYLLGANAPGREEDGAAPFSYSMADPVCARIAAGSCSDLHVLEPKQKKGAKTAAITVEAVREASAFLQLTSSHSGRKCVIFDALDDMNANAQNAALKMLEEPAGDSYLILIAHRAGAALPTIRSRCRPVYMGAPDAESALKALQGAEPETDEAALIARLRLSGFSPGAACALNRHNIAGDCAAMLDALAAAGRGNDIEAASALNRISLAGDGESWKALMRVLCEHLTEAMHPQDRADTLLPPHKAENVYRAYCLLARKTETLYLDKKNALYSIIQAAR